MAKIELALTPAAMLFPDLPQTTGLMKPCRFEGDVSNLEIIGSIPEEIDGTFYRVMPDPQFPAFIKDDPVRAFQFNSPNARSYLIPSFSGSTGMGV